MDPEPTQPPTLTAKDVAKVEALIDPNPLPCGGRGLWPNTPRTARWSFGKRSTAAVARYHLGMGWPSGILRRTCPAGLDRCLTHRTDDPAAVAPAPPHTAPNTVLASLERTSTPPGGNEPVGQVEPDAALLRGVRWATTAAADHPPPAGPNVAPPPPPGQTPGTAPALPPPLPPGAASSQPPERGLGAGGTQGQGTGRGQGPPGRPPRRRPRTPHDSRRTWGRVWRTLAAVAAAWALIFALARSCAAVTGIDLPDIPVNVDPGRPEENPPNPPAPTDAPATAPPETPVPTVSSIGPVFRVCPPSWETTTSPVEGCP